MTYFIRVGYSFLELFFFSKTDANRQIKYQAWFTKHCTHWCFYVSIILSSLYIVAPYIILRPVVFWIPYLEHSFRYIESEGSEKLVSHWPDIYTVRIGVVDSQVSILLFLLLFVSEWVSEWVRERHTERQTGWLTDRDKQKERERQTSDRDKQKETERKTDRDTDRHIERHMQRNNDKRHRDCEESTHSFPPTMPTTNPPTVRQARTSFNRAVSAWRRGTTLLCTLA